MFTWVRSSGSGMTLTISSGALTLSSSAAAHFQHVRYVMVGIDKENGRVALRPISRRVQEQGTIPADALYRISIGKGYARVTSKSVIRQLSEAFGRSFDHVRCPAYYDEEEDMLIARITDEGGDAS